MKCRVGIVVALLMSGSLGAMRQSLLNLAKSSGIAVAAISPVLVPGAFYSAQPTPKGLGDESSIRSFAKGVGIAFTPVVNVFAGGVIVGSFLDGDTHFSEREKKSLVGYGAGLSLYVTIPFALKFLRRVIV